MFGVIVYAGISFGVAVIMTVAYIMTRKFELRDEARPGRAFVIWFVIALIGPYALEEGLTRTIGVSMKDVVAKSYNALDFDGKMLYYKVTFFTGKTAKVIAVGEEKQSWGGMDHPVVSMSLVKSGEKWKVDSYKVVMSDKLNKDGIVYPPLW